MEMSRTSHDPPIESRATQTQVERTSVEHSWWFQLCANNYVLLIWGLIGVVCAYFAGHHLLKGNLSRILSCVLVIGFVALAKIGFDRRNTPLLRVPPADFKWKYFVIAYTSAITVTVSLTYKISELSVIGFSYLGVSLFCLTMIVQPVGDYLLFQYFAWMPFQVAVGHYKGDIHASYFVTAIVAAALLACQAFFSEHFDKVYANRESATRQRRSHQANMGHMLRNTRPPSVEAPLQ